MDNQRALRQHFGVLWRDVPPTRTTIRINDGRKVLEESGSVWGRLKASSSTHLFMYVAVMIT